MDGNDDNEGVGALSVRAPCCATFVRLLAQRAAEERPPWQLASHDARRARSREPRVVQQVVLERAFATSVVAGVWRALRRVALPARHYVVTHREFVDCLCACGVVATMLQRSLLELFRDGLQQQQQRLGHHAVVEATTSNNGDGESDARQAMSALAVCKAIEMAILDERARNEAASTTTTSGNDDDEGDGSGAARGIVAHGYRCYRLAHATHRHDDSALVAHVHRACAHTDDVVVVSWPVFVRVYYEDGGVLASGLVTATLEACNKYMRAPFGRFPVLAPRWLRDATRPLEYDTTCLADADALLLRDADAAMLARRTNNSSSKSKMRNSRSSQRERSAQRR